MLVSTELEQILSVQRPRDDLTEPSNRRTQSISQYEQGRSTSKHPRCLPVSEQPTTTSVLHQNMILSFLFYFSIVAIATGLIPRVGTPTPTPTNTVEGDGSSGPEGIYTKIGSLFTTTYTGSLWRICQFWSFALAMFYVVQPLIAYVGKEVLSGAKWLIEGAKWLFRAGAKWLFRVEDAGPVDLPPPPSAESAPLPRTTHDTFGTTINFNTGSVVHVHSDSNRQRYWMAGAADGRQPARSTTH